jgi:hypothetical protein
MGLQVLRPFKLDSGTIGRRIKERRLERNETQQAVGKACGLSQLDGLLKGGVSQRGVDIPLSVKKESM